jgi:hypothetical protein
LRIWIASRARPNEDDVVDSWNCHHHHHQSSSLPVLSRSTKLPTDDGFPACISPPPPSLTLAQSFVFFFFAIRSFEKFRGCTHTNMHVLIHVLCVWPSLSTRWKWGLARSNLNLVFIFSPLSWVSQGRERGGREEGDLKFAISITWRASRILANEKEISPTDSSHSDYSVVFSPLTLTGVVLSRWTRQNDDRCRLSIDFATQFSLVICSSS